MVQVPVDRHPLLLLPALDGRHVPVQVEGNLLPGIKATLRRDLGQRFVERRFGHWPLLGAVRRRVPDCTAPDGNGKRRNLAANGRFRSLLLAQCPSITQFRRGVPGYGSPQYMGAGLPALNLGWGFRCAVDSLNKSSVPTNFWRRLCTAKLSSGR